MRVASIVPTKYLYMVYEDIYHLCLIQQLQADPAYRDFYRTMVDKGAYVIVDNGAAEQHRSTIQEVYCATMGLKASELQLPDVFFDKEQTLKESAEALQFLEREGYDGPIQAVPQGKDLSEWYACMKEMHSWEEVTCIGIPKNLTHTSGPVGRSAAVAMVVMLNQWNKVEKEIHLLGCWDNPLEVGSLNRIFGNKIRGIDSGIPTIYAQQGKLLDPEMSGKPQEKVNFDATVDPIILSLNIYRWRRYCNGEPVLSVCV